MLRNVWALLIRNFEEIIFPSETSKTNLVKMQFQTEFTNNLLDQIYNTFYANEKGLSLKEMECMSSTLRLGINSFKENTKDLLNLHKKYALSNFSDEHVLTCILKARSKNGDKDAKFYLKDYKGPAFMKLSLFQNIIPSGKNNKIKTKK